MTGKDCQNFMVQQDIYKHWILPLHNLNAGTVYAGRPMGNSPELMPLYSNLNKDIQKAVKKHAAYINSLKRNNPKQFSTVTAKQGVSASSFSPDGGVTSSICIMKDVNRIFDKVLIKLVEACNENNMNLLQDGNLIKNDIYKSP